jgi:hypothetical protein
MNDTGLIDKTQLAETKEWIIGIEKLLTGKGCKSIYQKNMHTGDGYEYYHKKTKIRICKIAANEKICFIMLHGNHFPTEYCIVNELPESMLYPLKNQRGCRPCADPSTCTMAGNGERYYEFTHNGRNYLCCGGGFKYDLNETADLNLLKKWIEAELHWYENDLAAYPEKKIILDEIESSYAKRWVKNRIKSEPIGENLEEFYIFEADGKEQMRVKPPIEAARDYFLRDEKSNADMTRLINYQRNLGMELKWKAKNKYVFRHKKTELLYFRLEGLNDFNIMICAVYYGENKDVYQEFIDSLPADKKQKYVSIKELNCHECNEICNKRMGFVISDKEYILCSSKSYLCENPAKNKLDEIEWLININRDYINFKISKNKIYNDENRTGHA